MDSKELKVLKKIQMLTLKANITHLMSHKRNQSIRNLAYVTGISHFTLNQIMKGKGNPSLHTINILSSHFHVNILEPIFIVTDESSI